MIRTKYLLVTILVCLFTIIATGVFSVAPHMSDRGASSATVIFATPQDSYQIEKYADTIKDTTRKEFIEKVRDSIAQDPVTTIQRSPSVETVDEEETVSAPEPAPEPTPEPEPIPVVPQPVIPVVVTPVPVTEPEPQVASPTTTDSETQTIEEVPAEESPTI
jgi:hypothetical protein